MLSIKEGSAITILRRNWFVSPYRNILLNNLSVLHKKSGIEKIYGYEVVGVSRFSFENFLSHSIVTFRNGTVLCCVSEIFRWWKSLSIRRGRVSIFSVETSLSHSNENFRRGSPLCFRKLLVVKTVRVKIGGGYHDFPSNLSFITLRKHSVEKPFCASQKIWYRIYLWIEGRVE